MNDTKILIPTPKNQTTIKEFYESHKEAFDKITMYGEALTIGLKKEYVFDGWHMIIPDSKYSVSENGVLLFAVIPAISNPKNCFLNIGSKELTQFRLGELDNLRFNCYHREQPYGYVAISLQDDVLSTCQIATNATGNYYVAI